MNFTTSQRLFRLALHPQRRLQEPRCGGTLRRRARSGARHGVVGQAARVREHLAHCLGDSKGRKSSENT